MLEKGRFKKVGLALVATGALCLSTSTGAVARPFGLLLGGGLHHLGGFGGGLHRFGGFGGGFRPGGFGGGLHGGGIGFRQAGVGYPGFRQAGIGYRGYGSAGGSRWQNGSGRYWGAYGAAAAVGAIGAAGASSSGYSTQDSDNSQYPANSYYAYPAYGY